MDSRLQKRSTLQQREGLTDLISITDNYYHGYKIVKTNLKSSR